MNSSLTERSASGISYNQSSASLLVRHGTTIVSFSYSVGILSPLRVLNRSLDSRILT